MIEFHLFYQFVLIFTGMKQKTVFPGPVSERTGNVYAVYRIPRIRYTGTWRWQAHYHDEFELVYLPPSRAEGEVCVDGRRFSASGGLFLAITPNTVHSFDLFFPRESAMYIIIVSREALISMVSRWPECEKKAIGGMLEAIPVQWTQHAHLLAPILLSLSLCSGRETHPVHQALSDTAALMTLFAHLSDPLRNAPPRQESPLVAALRELLDNTDNDNVPFSRMAQRCGVSRSHASRCFNKEMGMSVQQYRNTRRVARAGQMLRSSDASIARIALACGFGDQSRFSRVFRQYMGVSPLQFRKNR